MKGNLIIGALIIVVVGIVGVMATGVLKGDTSSEAQVAATIYKSPSCGCCGEYAKYLEREGYGIEVKGVQDMSVIKEQYGVPYELESCHTMKIGGYIIEGHVPEVAVQKLLSEKPDIKGIGMAGMPSGSPGMPGPKRSEFVVYEITHNGTKGNVFTTM